LVTRADRTSQIDLEQVGRATFTVDCLKPTSAPAIIVFGVFLTHGHLVLDLTVEEARVLIARFESVIEEIANEIEQVIA